LLKQRELPEFARVNKVTSASLGYTLSVFNKNCARKGNTQSGLDRTTPKSASGVVFGPRHTRLGDSWMQQVLRNPQLTAAKKMIPFLATGCIKKMVNFNLMIGKAVFQRPLSPTMFFLPSQIDGHLFDAGRVQKQTKDYANLVSRVITLLPSNPPEKVFFR